MKLFPYQEEGVAFMQNVHGGILLADEMGLGKTNQVCTLANRQNLWPLLVVCPASLKHNWERELRTWAGADSLILSGKVPADLPDELPKAVIVNYDILYEQQQTLLNVPWKCIAFDECHNLANRSAKRTKAAKRLSRLSTKVIGISGTPVMNRPADFWPILNIIRPELFPSWQAYAWKFCDPKKTHWGWEYKGAKNLEELHASIKPFTLRRLKKNVLELPDKKLVVLPMDLQDPEELQRAETDFIGWLSENSKMGSVASAKKAEAVTRLGVLLRLTSKLKCRAIVAWARQFLRDNPTEKLILFGIHTAMLDVLRRRILPEGVVVIDGSVSSKKRQAVVDQFQNDPGTRLMVANIKAAGVGITLTASSTVAMAELWWTPSAMEQASDRVHRLTQSKQCTIYYLVVPGSIEERLCDAIQSKQKIANSIIDGHQTTEIPVLDMLLSKKGGLLNAKSTKA